MLVPARAVYMPVGNFLVARGTNLQNLNIEHQVATGQGMIGIEISAELAQLYYGSGASSLLRVYLYQHAFSQAAFVQQVLHRHALLALWVPDTIGVNRFKTDAKNIASGFTRHAAFQTGQNIVGAMQVRTGLTVARGLQFLTVRIAQRVVEGNYGVSLNIHGRVRRCELGRRLQFKMQGLTSVIVSVFVSACLRDLNPSCLRSDRDSFFRVVVT